MHWLRQAAQRILLAPDTQCLTCKAVFNIPGWEEVTSRLADAGE